MITDISLLMKNGNCRREKSITITF